jgi:pentatricopeptide repeat protein
MRAQAVPLSTYSCNVLADACIRCGQPQRALKLYRDFEAGTARDFPLDEPTRQLDVRSFNIMLKAHREMGQLEGALGTLAALKVRESIDMRAVCLFVWLCGVCGLVCVCVGSEWGVERGRGESAVDGFARLARRLSACLTITQ